VLADGGDGVFGLGIGQFGPAGADVFRPQIGKGQPADDVATVEGRGQNGDGGADGPHGAGSVATSEAIRAATAMTMAAVRARRSTG